MLDYYQDMENVNTINQETGTKYSRQQLKDAFDKVCDKANWKLPIVGAIHESEIDVTREAVIFFAGCTPTFHRFSNGTTVVQAIGYYAAVGA